MLSTNLSLSSSLMHRVARNPAAGARGPAGGVDTEVMGGTKNNTALKSTLECACVAIVKKIKYYDGYQVHGHKGNSH